MKLQTSTVKNVVNKVTDPATTVKAVTTWNNGHEVLSRTANKENGLPQAGEGSSKLTSVLGVIATAATFLASLG